MNRYDDYIERVCRTGKYTSKQARGLALSKEVEKYYQNEESQNMENKSTYTPVGECI